MRIAVDSNIVYSAILNTEGRIGDILLNSQEQFVFYACEYLREEIEDHKAKIMTAAEYDERTFSETKYLVYSSLKFFTESVIPFEFWRQAADLVRDIDMDDIAFVALSLFLDIKLWTGDKKLREGLARKGFANSISTQELLVFREKAIGP